MKEAMKFSPATTVYPAPDFKLIAQSTKDISRLVFFQTEKMEAVQSKAKRVSSYALELQTILGEELISLSTTVESLDFTDVFSQIAEIDRELAKGTLSAEEKEAAREAREEQVSFFAGGIGGTHGKLRDAAVKVQQKAGEIGAVVLAERTEESLKQAQSRQPEISKALGEKETAIKKLGEDRDKIVAAQDVIRARNIADIVKDFIPKDLEKLDLKKPEVEAVKLGVEVLKKILGEVSEGFKYSDLADQRKALDGKIEELDNGIRSLQAEQRENDALVDDLSSVMSIDSKRAVFLGEVNKLPAAWSGFADSLAQLNGTQVTEASVTNALNTIKSYLANCLDARNKVIIT
jgi:hypothetical protein